MHVHRRESDKGLDIRPVDERRIDLHSGISGEEMIRIWTKLRGWGFKSSELTELARLVVQSVRTFGCRLSRSRLVSIAFTTRTASEGSEPLIADVRADVRLSTSSIRTHTFEPHERLVSQAITTHVI